MDEKKQKQIEEIANVIYDDPYSYDTYWRSHCEQLAETLYNAGYRKQSEGEWIVCGMFDDFFKCSSCGDKHPIQTAIEYKYCPNCGAKMKGGAE